MMNDDPRIEEIKNAGVMYENFPKPGVNFVDIFPLVSNGKAMNLVTDIFEERLLRENIQFDKICML